MPASAPTIMPHNSFGSATVSARSSQAVICTLQSVHVNSALMLQRMHGSSSSLGTSPKSSGSYWQSNGVSSDAEDVRSSSSANGSMPHLEVCQSLVLPPQLGPGIAHALLQSQHHL